MDIKNKTFKRFLDAENTKLDINSNVVRLAFSSEAPVLREMGSMTAYEVLEHSTEAVDLSRLQNGAPLLVEHNPADQVGVVESVSIDSDRIGRVAVRFSSSTRAQEVFKDVSEGIRRHVSVGYQILDYRLDKRAKGSEELDTYRVTKWRPLEVSIVSIPADDSIGVGRSKQFTHGKSPMNNLNLDKERELELERIRDIRNMGESFKQANLAEKYIRSGNSVSDFRDELLSIMERKTFAENAETGFITPTEQRTYSIVNVIRSLSGDTSVDIGYEREINQELQSKRSVKSKGFSIPLSQMAKRDLTAAGGGSSLVNPEYRPDMMVNFLRNKSAVINAGGQTINLESGQVVIPRQTGTATAEWLDLDGTDEITGSEQTFDQLSLNMKSLTAMTTYTHRMLKQGLPDIENIIMQDLAGLFAVEIDKAAINGSAAEAKVPTGILNQTGILTQTVADAGKVPTFAETIGFEEKLAAANSMINGAMYVTTPAIAMALKATPKDAGSGQFIWETTNENEGRMNGFKAVYTNNMPTGKVLFGNFQDLIVGYWGTVELMVNPYGDNFNKGSVSVRAILDCDMNVRRPQSFCATA